MSSPRLFGDYVLLEPVGKGAQGSVELAVPLHAARLGPELVVIKRLHPEFVSHRELLSRFRHEAKIAVSIEHARVVRVLDVGAVGSVPYIAMEHVLGISLSRFYPKLSADQGLLPIAAAAGFIVELLSGLGAIHGAVDKDSNQPLDAIHRDLSPRNIMVRAAGGPCLIDMGLGTSNVKDWQTRAGNVMGSPGYMAPEQLSGRLRVDRRADLYVAGVLLFELLTSQTFVALGGDLATRLANTERALFRPPSGARDGVPPSLDRVVEQAVERDPSRRFDSAEAFRRALLEAVPPASIEAFDRVARDWFAAEFEGLERRRQALLAEIGAGWDHTQLSPTPDEKTVFARRATPAPDAAAPAEARTVAAWPRARSSAPEATTIEPALPAAQEGSIVPTEPGLPPTNPATSPQKTQASLTAGALSSPAALSALDAARESAPTGSIAGSTLSPAPAAPTPPRRSASSGARWTRGVAVAALVIGSAVLAVALDRAMFRGPPTSQLVEPSLGAERSDQVEPRAPAPGARAIEPSPATKAAAPASGPGAVLERRAPSSLRMRSPAAAPETEAAVAAGNDAEPADTDAIRARIARIAELAKAKKTADPERAAEIDAIVLRATRWASSSDEERALPALRALESQLE